jgi:hypothetical protein
VHVHPVPPSVAAAAARAGAGRFPRAGRGAEYSLGGAWTIIVLFTRPPTFPACPLFLEGVCSTCICLRRRRRRGGGAGAFPGVVCAAGDDPVDPGCGSGAGGVGDDVWRMFTSLGVVGGVPGGADSSLGLMCALFARRKPPRFPRSLNLDEEGVVVDLAHHRRRLPLRLELRVLRRQRLQAEPDRLVRPELERRRIRGLTASEKSLVALEGRLDRLPGVLEVRGPGVQVRRRVGGQRVALAAQDVETSGHSGTRGS